MNDIKPNYSEMLFQALKPSDPLNQLANLNALGERLHTAESHQAADETRKADQADRLDADLTRLDLDQKNRSYAAFGGMNAGVTFVEFKGKEPL